MNAGWRTSGSWLRDWCSTLWVIRFPGHRRSSDVLVTATLFRWFSGGGFEPEIVQRSGRAWWLGRLRVRGADLQVVADQAMRLMIVVCLSGSSDGAATLGNGLRWTM